MVKRSKNRLSKNGLLLMGGLTLLVVVLVGYPLISLLTYSLGIKGQSLELTDMYYLRAFQDMNTLVALKNTFYVSTGVTIFALLLGGGLAWLLMRTDLPFKRAFNLLIFITFTIPSYILAVAWIELLGRNGFINRILCNEWQLISQPLNIYSLEGIIFILVLHSFPMVFMALAGTLKLNDRTLEMAARLAGARCLQTLLSITLPLILPAILSVSLMIFQQTMANFGVPAIIGLPNGHYVMTTRIYSSLSQMDLSMVTALSIILLLCSGGVFYLYHLSLRRKRYIHLSSTSQAAELIPLGRGKIPAVIGIAFLFLVTTILPLGTLLVSSFLKSWGLALHLENLTLHNYAAIFWENTIALRAIGNSMGFGILAASVTVVLGTAVAYISTKTVTRGRKVLELLATCPLAVPGTVMAVAATLAWINEPLKLYGTPWIIIITYFAACLPFGVRNINGLLQGMDPILDDAARVAGASGLKTFRDITLPAIIPGMRIGWITSFLMVLREIPISIMLYSVGSETIGVLFYRMRSDTGGLETVSAIAVIVIVLTILGNLLIGKFGKSPMEVLDGSRRNTQYF